MMRGKQMASPWRTIQVFISSQAAGIFEVEVDTQSKALRCNCPVWNKRQSCKHTKFVSQKMMLNHGHYSITVGEAVDEDIDVEDPKKFREYVLKYAKVEVL